jgi:hypothetical protein
MTKVTLADERGEILAPALKFALLDVAAAQTDAVVVAAVTGKKIRVLNYAFTIGAAGTVLFESGTATALTGVMNFAAAETVSFEGSADSPAFETAAGAALTLTNTGAGADVRGHLCYVEIP